MSGASLQTQQASNQSAITQDDQDMMSEEIAEPKLIKKVKSK